MAYNMRRAINMVGVRQIVTALSWKKAFVRNKIIKKVKNLSKMVLETNYCGDNCFVFWVFRQSEEGEVSPCARTLLRATLSPRGIYETIFSSQIRIFYIYPPKTPIEKSHNILNRDLSPF